MSGAPPKAEIASAVRRAAEKRREMVVELRRRLHRVPELAFEERETTGIVAAFLGERGIPFERSASGTGGVSVIGREGQAGVILRADLDGLPVDEAADVPFRSQRPGRMHACGHDAHVAILLAAADALAAGEVPPSPSGPVICLFQPAEEGGGGCPRLLREGLLDRHPARRAFALHVWPELRTGSVGVGPGPIMACMDRVRLVFRGRGGHGAYPHACVDPVVMAAEAVVALQSAVSRRIDPLEPAVFTLGSIHGGSASNIIPESVELQGTIRAFRPEVRLALLQGIGTIASGVASAHGGAAEMTVDGGYPVTRNDPATAGLLAEALAEVLGSKAVVPMRPTMGSEDFGFLLEKVPGCYIQLGAAAAPASSEPLHSPRFTIDEGCLTVGVMTLLAAATMVEG